MPFRLVDHTADLGIEASAETSGDTLAQAALALTCVVTGKEHPHLLGHPTEELDFPVEAPDLQALAVAFLAELLWFLESRDLLWVGGGVHVEPAGEVLRAVASGNAIAYDPVRHGRGVEVKAVTYHDIEFVERDGAWHLRVLLDI